MGLASDIGKAFRSIPTWGWVVGGTLAATGLALLFWRNAAAARPLEPGQRRVLVLGDSLTVGYLPKLRAILEAKGDVVIGSGYGGAQVAAITKKAEGYYDQVPTHVVILAGINDLASGKSATDTYKALAAFWRAAKNATEAKIVAVLLTPCASYPACKAGTAMNGGRVMINNMITSALGSPDAVDAVIDTDPLGDGNGALLKQYSSGGLHLSSAGYQKLAELVAGGMP